VGRAQRGNSESHKHRPEYFYSARTKRIHEQRAPSPMLLRNLCSFRVATPAGIEPATFSLEGLDSPRCYSFDFDILLSVGEALREFFRDSMSFAVVSMAARTSSTSASV
jgi:hypothetical protein